MLQNIVLLVQIGMKLILNVLANKKKISYITIETFNFKLINLIVTNLKILLKNQIFE